MTKPKHERVMVSSLALSDASKLAYAASILYKRNMRKQAEAVMGAAASIIGQVLIDVKVEA